MPRLGFDIAAFAINWQTKTAICPQSQVSVDWTPGHDKWGNSTIHVGFHRRTCAACISRPLCTKAKSDPSELTLRQQFQHDALQDARRQQENKDWRARYRKRAGIEGTLSQAVRGFGLRQYRYRGLAKTKLQHIFTAVAINLARLDAWLTEHTPLPKQNDPPSPLCRLRQHKMGNFRIRQQYPLLGICRTEFATPSADGFVRHDNAAFQKHFPHQAQGKRETEVQPHRMGNDLWWETVVLVADDRRVHRDGLTVNR
ncbi:hypothetical protein G6L08_22585 [Agrobacterium rhizogenes]|nr:hypothetical protein [Rhizobium rhizogenes]